MKRNDSFFKQAALMLRVMPLVAKEKCFALKGGTAINFFLREMPRLSVDIDLAYLPIESRSDSLSKISDALVRISTAIQRAHKKIKVREARASIEARITKLFVSDGEVQVKIEPNEVIRGSVFGTEERSVTPIVEETFESSATMQVLSIPDLYGGKLCAALDRQHPRDIFDVKLLLEGEGVTPEIRKAFVVYLAGHSRPIHELLDPKRKDMRAIYDREFVGMTTIPVSYQELESVREQYATALREDLTTAERRFLLSVKERDPDWSLLGIEGLDQLPSIQWKLANLSRMTPKKHADAVSKLKRVLAL